MNYSDENKKEEKNKKNKFKANFQLYPNLDIFADEEVNDVIAEDLKGEKQDEEILKGEKVIEL